MPLDNTIQKAGDATSKVIDKTVKHYGGIYAPVDKMIDQFIDRIPYLIAALLVLVIFWLIGRLFKYVIKKTLSDRVERRQNLVKALNRIGSTFIIFLGVLVAMVVAIPGFTTAKMIGGLGIGSVAIGFAFKDIFQNMLSGIFILLAEPFRIGDQIVMGAFEGTVEDIQIRATYIRTYDGRRIIIPNADIFATPVTVNTAFKRRRCQVDFGIGLSDDVARAKILVREALKSCSTVTDSSNTTIVAVGFSDHAMQLRLRWWIEDSAQVDMISSTDQVLVAVKSALTKAGVNLPHLTAPVQAQAGGAQGDQRRREGSATSPPNAAPVASAVFDIPPELVPVEPANRRSKRLKPDAAVPSVPSRDDSEAANPERD